MDSAKVPFPRGCRLRFPGREVVSSSHAGAIPWESGMTVYGLCLLQLADGTGLTPELHKVKMAERSHIGGPTQRYLTTSFRPVAPI
jgi:hypothetical protein